MYDDLVEWKKDVNKKALVICGCRQIGKTYTVLEFAKKNYSQHLYINLEDEEGVREIFENKDISAENIIKTLSFIKRIDFSKDTVLILDEVQSSSGAYSALKSLNDCKKCDVIATGSFLGLEISRLQRLTPMGHVDFRDMWPMDFEEFLWATGMTEEHTNYLRECINNRKRIEPIICDRMNEEFRKYILVGGFPEAVKTYVETGSYHKVLGKLKDISKVIGQDAEKYSSSTDRKKIKKCIESTPQQLSTNRGKFIYSAIEKNPNASRRTYENALNWLEESGLIRYCYNLTQTVSPLIMRVRQGSFKVYLTDTGILSSMLKEDVAEKFMKRDSHSDYGILMENAIACALMKNDHPLYFYEKANSTLEIDFILSIHGEIMGVEVKSGRDKRSKSLKEAYLEQHMFKHAVKLSEGNVFTDENGIQNLPLFAPCFMRMTCKEDSLPVRDDGELMAAFDAVLGKGNPERI